MEKSKVAVVQCTSYDEQSVHDAVRDGIELLGGPDQFVAPGEKLLLKPNVLAGDHPDRCISTHPSVLKAAGRLFRSRASEISYGDSPGFGSVVSQLEKAQLKQAAEETDMTLADFEEGRDMSFPRSPFTKRFLLANGVLETDAIISLCKLKTHGLTRVTGAIKNQFGCIPGAAKKGFHLKMPDSRDFAKMLVALTLMIRPRLYIMDGIMAMEGNGPRGGDPVPMNVLLLSNDPVALDAVMCSLIELNPEYVPAMVPGREWGLGTYLPDEMEVLGNSTAGLRNGDFKIDRGPFRNVLPQGIMSFVKNLTTVRPVIDSNKCVACGVCVKVCPVDPKAVDWHRGKKSEPPTYRYSRCIRCFCCQELCPEGAISVVPGPINPFGRR